MIPFPDKRYNIIYADPPWRNPKSGTKARNNEKHYPSMSTEDICALPVRDIRKPDCVREEIVHICGDLPRIELFARQRVAGWDAWGNEVEEQ